jgi:fused signal recognition particle receptor
MGTELLFLILAVLVVAFGIGVLIVSRRNAAAGRPPRDRAVPPTTPPPRDGDGGGTVTLEREDLQADISEVDIGDVDIVEVEIVEPVVEPEIVRPASLRERLAKARTAFTGAVAGILGRGSITEESFEDLEEALLRADVGVGVTTDLLDVLRAKVEAKEITEPQALLDALELEMLSRLEGSDRTLAFEPGDPGSPNVWLFVGVNGVGKTTTIGKVANQQIRDGRSVLLAAGDTFRAAAAEQLTTWAERAGAEIVRGAEGGDPSSVVFDGVERAAARGTDLVLADTAGRLHTKSNLMEELRKVRRVAEKGAGRVTETLLVIDATTGQNGLTQAREFREVTDVTGVVLTKLDGSAKGGIVFAIETELGIPVKLVGIGETIEDLVPFRPAEFVSALVEP